MRVHSTSQTDVRLLLPSCTVIIRMLANDGEETIMEKHGIIKVKPKYIWIHLSCDDSLRFPVLCGFQMHEWVSAPLHDTRANSSFVEISGYFSVSSDDIIAKTCFQMSRKIFTLQKLIERTIISFYFWYCLFIKKKKWNRKKNI